MDKNVKRFYTIPRENFSSLEEKLNKLNKRAKKLQLPEIHWEIVGGETVEHKDGLDVYSYNENLFVTVRGEHPSYAGWMFCAALDHSFESGALIRTAPFSEHTIPEIYRTSGPVCDHCGHKRNRKATYVLQHETEGFKQVGSTCIKDFLGGKSPDSLAAWAEIIFSLDGICVGFEEGEGGGSGQSGYTLTELLPQVAAFIRVDGWTSRTAARDDYSGRSVATADSVAGWLMSNKIRERIKEEDHKRWEDLQVTNEDRKIASESVAWVESDIMEKLDKNDYEHNISLVVHEGWCPDRGLGVAASIVAVYLRHLDKLSYNKAQESLPPLSDKHFGTVGTRVTVQAYVTGISTIDGYYGTTDVISLRILDGAQSHKAVWFASGGSIEILEILTCGEETALVSGHKEFSLGVTVWVTGTIKDHSEYKGTPQTRLNRCKLFGYNPEDKENKKLIRKLKKDGKVLDKWEWENLVERLA